MLLSGQRASLSCEQLAPPDEPPGSFFVRVHVQGPDPDKEGAISSYRPDARSASEKSLLAEASSSALERPFVYAPPPYFP